MSRRERWNGWQVVVTGGSSGIGKQVAADLLRRGAHVCLVADGAEKLAEAEAELRRLSPYVWSWVCDVSDLAQVRALGVEYRRRGGVPNAIVNNAGYAVYETFEQMSIEEIERLLAVNLGGAAFITREFLPDMIRAGGGDVVMVSSIAGRLPLTPCCVYGAAKQGMVALAEMLLIEVGRFNIRVQVVCPGRVDTEFFSHESFRRRAHRRETEFTIPIETVSRAIIGAAERNRFLTYVPWHYGLLAWAVMAFPMFARPLWHRLLRARIETYYRTTQRP